MDKAARIRSLVLDAAEKCLLEGGFRSARLLTAIAHRAGLSRPTLYKYVGDQDAIIGAVVQRELDAFLDDLKPIMDRPDPPPDHLVDVLVFVVERTQRHALLQAALREIPERLLPWFTTRASLLLTQVEPELLPRVRRNIEDGLLPDVDPRVLLDGLCRVALSLVFTTGLVDLSRPDELRAYLATFLPAWAFQA